MANDILIAECCQNHNGSINILKEMVNQASIGGATHVKMQTIFSKNLSFRPQFESGMKDFNGNEIYIKRPYEEEYKRLKSLELDEDSHKIFINSCIENNVKPLTTCFTHEDVGFIKKLGFKAVKIASYDAASYEMVSRCIETFEEVFISTGASYDNEIEKLADVTNNNVPLLHCVTSYPNKCEDANISRINFLSKFSKKVGFSDHTEFPKDKNEASLVAIYFGAKLIERHFTILASDKTKDGKVSIDRYGLQEISNFFHFDKKQQLSYLNKNYPKWKRCIGNEKRDLSPSELLNRRYYKGRFATPRSKQYNFPPTEWIYNWEPFSE